MGSKAMTPIKLSIGVANNEWGCTICIMQHHEDESITVHYSGVHPEGDSAGIFEISLDTSHKNL